MKRLSCIILCLAGLLAIPALGQEKIAEDPQMIIGKLENGMTYYIRHNSKPEKCADFYIIHNVGALQEEDNQNGLAHFLEHMAFNGTKHYPDQQMLTFLSKEGVRFGYNVNAYTSRTETVYNLSEIPLVRESFADSVLLILHDWSGDISCKNEALDAERGVISEEWRRADEPRRRMADMQTGLLYKGGKQAKRNVLGSLEVINGFKREEILDFYHKWYRPDLQAIVVVGDFDPKVMESKVKKIFSDIPAAVDPEPKVIYEAPELTEPLYENMLDPQVNFYVLKAIHKQKFPERELRNTDFFFKDQFSRQIVSSILEARLRRDAKRQGSPVSSAMLVTNPVVADYYNSMFTLSAKNQSLMEETFAFYAEEIEKILRFGFSEDEFTAAKHKVFKKNKFNQEVFASEVSNEDIVDMCKEHFLRGYACAFPYDYKQLQKAILSDLSYEDVKGYENKMFRDSEIIYSYCVNDKKSDILPSKERMQEILAEVKAADLQPDYITYDKIDLGVDPQAGRIVKSAAFKGSETEEWTLGNGVKVYFTPAGPVKSTYHISMNAYFDTGFKALDPARIVSSKVAISYIDRNLGFRNHDKSSVSDSPECSGVRTMTSINRIKSQMSLQADKNNIETAFKVFYLSLTDPYFGKVANLNKFVQDNVRSMKSEKKDSDNFTKEFRLMRYGYNPWREKIDSSDVLATDMALVEDVFHRSFDKLEGMEIHIVSDMDKADIRLFVEKYVASLDMEYDYEESKDYGEAPKYKGRNELDREYEIVTVPKSTVDYYFKTKIKPTPENEVAMEIFKYIMSNRYRIQIREARGGTYHVGFTTERFLEEGDVIEANVNFQTRPELLEVLLKDVEDEMTKLGKENPTQEEMEAAKRYLVKRYHEQKALKSNDLAHKNQKIHDYIKFGIEPEYDYEAVISGISAKDIGRVAEKFAKGDILKTAYSENK